jgi:hypothetical protein
MSTLQKLAILLLLPGTAVARSRHWSQGEEVPLYANKVGPYVNPSETYNYYDLPFCQTTGMEEPHQSLGEDLKGDELTKSLFDVKFKVNVEMATLCEMKFSQSEKKQFSHAIDDDYYFEFVVDKLPMWGFVGEIKTKNATELRYLFAHLHFQFGYHEDQIVEATVSTDAKLEAKLDSPKAVKFTYSVTWTPSHTEYSKRMEKYAKASFLPMHLQVHWFSIINSFVTVLLLTGFLATIMMRILKNDFHKYAGDAEDAMEDDDDTGWKMIHGDVFRFPPYVSLLSSVIGIGAQLYTLMISLFVLGVVGVFHPHSGGSIQVAVIVLYAMTAGIAGYVSALVYRKFKGENWVRNVIQTALLLTGPCCIVFCFENTVAVIYSATASLPFGTIMLVLVIWALITFPLTVVGGIVGKNAATEFDAPCRTKLIPNKIPELPWYRRAVVQMVMAGFLPFSAIYIEIYYIFASVWGHKIYTVYSILFIVFIILTVVTSFITIALTYFQLAVEDHEWCAWPATCHKDTSQATFTLRLTNASRCSLAGGGGR